MGRIDSKGDRTTIADLECYGLSIRSINAIETHLKVLYVDEMQHVTEEMVLAIPMAGASMVRELRGALRNWRAGLVVKTVDQCLEFQGDG